MKVQSLEGCLIQALRGSCLENRKGVENALILLMETGASIYGEGHCEFTLTKYLRPVEQRGPRCGSSIRFPRRMTEINKRLTSKDLWASALNACGYDADKVISSMLSTDWPIRTHDRIVGYEARWASALNACGHDADKVISSMLSIDRPIRTHDRIVGYGARGPSLYVSDYSITEILSSTPRFQHDSKYSRKIIIYHDKVRGLDAPHR